MSTHKLGQRLVAVLLPVGAAAVTIAWHLRWLALDQALPRGDAAGHLLNVARHADWLQGARMPVEAFPPGLYVVSGMCVRLLGATVDAAATGTVLFSGLLAAVLSRIGHRASGVLAGVLLPLLALAAPSLAGCSREILLDLPMAACIAAIWLLAWESDAFRRPIPTVLLGVAMGAAALVKYTFIPWVLPAVVLAGLAMIVRSPLSALPLVLVAAPAWFSWQVLASRARAPQGTLPDPDNARLLFIWVLGSAALALSVAVRAETGARATSPRWAGVGDGAKLATATLIAIAMVLPWFLVAMPNVWDKVHREAITEVRASGQYVGRLFVLRLLEASWPGTKWALSAAAALELGWIAAALRRWRRGEAIPMGPVIPIVLSCTFGVWFTASRLPVNARYYLPAVIGAAIVLGVGATRFRVGRWLFGPAAVAGLLVQLAADAGWGPAVRVDPLEFDSGVGGRMSPWSRFAPPAPAPDPLLRGIDVGLRSALGRVNPGCNQLVVALPSFPEARPLGIEPGMFLAMSALAGRSECAVANWDPEHPKPGGKPRWLLVAGLTAAAESERTGGLTLGAPEVAVEVDGRLARLYPVQAW